MLIRFEVPSFATEVPQAPSLRPVVAPNTDVLEGEKETVVLMEMPSVDKAAVKVSFERGILTVSGERKPLELPEKGRILLREQSAIGYRRTVRVHHPVDVGSLTATLENGVLRIVLPKAEIAKPHVIEVR
ncbi:MAG: Hsp20/alpha crystallin family protein [Bacteroidetes bacterium]|jgi:HSP20 family protein|nr:Hsp20/alpha crystallin family protein [Bacteroidota bacterium]